ncbi:MAG: tetratricopeptide repeat protein [Candidatus Cloacimonetes bacterium]|nr:tetratricopeptide repeat protein [Candidatus Cloacimonadota bacterium]
MLKEIDEFSFNEIFKTKPKYKKLRLKEGERKQVSILFADVSGFTSLSEKLDSEEIQTISDEILQIFTKCIEYYGGYIDKYEGDLVMALYGAKKASERDTERAISSALLMLKHLKLFNKKLQDDFKERINLKVRIGINTGLVTTGKVGKKREGDFTVYGTAVNIASRMESNAPLNRVMTTYDTKKMVEDIFEFENHGEISVKGISKPVSVFLVKDQKKERIKRWGLRLSQLVGRENEINLLEQKFLEVNKRNEKDKEEKPIIVGINGEPGIGKSRLVYEFLKKHSTFILDGTTPKTYKTHFALFTSLLGKYFEIFKSDSIEEKKAKLENGYHKIIKKLTYENDIEKLKDSLPLIGLLFHIKYDDPRLQFEGKELLAHIQTAIRHFIEAKAGEAQQNNSNLIIVLEDLHWLDDVSRSTINFILETLNLEEKRAKLFYKNVFFIFIYRPEYKIPKVVQEKKDFTEIFLKPLNEENAFQLIKSITCAPKIHDTTIKKVLKMSAGNPFYLEEWCNLVNDYGEKANQNSLPIPNSINALILARIDRLEKDIKQILQNAAVIGKEFLTKILSEVEKRLESAFKVNYFLEELETNEYLRRILGIKYSKYFFKHILTHEVAYNTILHSNRRILHKLVAEVIEEHFAENLENFYFELAHHYSKAKVKEKAIEYLEKAGDQAKKNFDNLNAIVCFEKACKMVDSFNIKLPELLIKVADTKKIIGDWNSAESTYLKALSLSKELSNKYLIGSCYLKLGSIESKRSNYRKAIDFLDISQEIFSNIDDQNGICLCKNEKGIIFSEKGNYEEAISLFSENLKIQKENKNKIGICKALGNIGIIYFKQYEFNKAYKFFIAQLSLNTQLDNLIGKSIVLGNIGNLLFKQKKYEEAEDFFEQQLLLKEEIGDLQGISKCYNNIGKIYSINGEYKKAFSLYQKKIAISRKLQDIEGLSSTISDIGIICFKKKKFYSASRFFKMSLNLAQDIKNTTCTYTALYNLGCSYQKIGKFYDAAVNFKDMIQYVKRYNLKINTHIIRYKLALMYLIENKYILSLKNLNLVIKQTNNVQSLKKINIKSKLLKTDLLYRLKKYKKAKNIIIDLISKDISNYPEIHIYNSKLEVAMLIEKGLAKRENVIRLKQEIDKLDDIVLKTNMYYDLIHIYIKLNLLKDSEVIASMTLKLYKTLYKERKDFFYKNRIQDICNKFN